MTSSCRSDFGCANGKVQLVQQPLDLNELARQTVEDHRELFNERGVELDLQGAPAAVFVNGDQTRLMQVVGNLLRNSAKFTPRGAKTTVSVQGELASGRALVRVEDTGCGIAPEMRPRLFQPFAQADMSLDRSKGGLGLGLALVKGLVEMHGGSVSAASDGPGKGAAFTVVLPLETKDVARAKEAGFDAHLAKPPSLKALEKILAGVGTVPR